MNFFKRKNKSNINFTEQELLSKDNILELELKKIFALLNTDLLILSFPEVKDMSFVSLSVLRNFLFTLKDMKKHENNKEIQIQINAMPEFIEQLKPFFRILEPKYIVKEPE